MLVRRLVTAALFVTGGVSLGACSNGDDFKPAAVASSSTTASAGPRPTTPTTRSSDPFCNFFQTFNDRFGRINPAIANPEQFRTVVQEAAGAIRDAQAIAPASIKADVSLLNDAFQQLVGVLQQVNFDVTRLDPTAFAGLADPRFKQASDRLEAYRLEHCFRPG